MERIIIGNLKSYLSPKEISLLLEDVENSNRLVIAPQSPYLGLIRAKYPNIKLSAQDVSSIADKYGAHTGEVSAGLLKDLGVSYAIIGHSERRAANLDNPSTISSKINHCLQVGTTPIICIGESKKDRDSGNYVEAILKQLEEIKPEIVGDIIIAYEPVWSIGTGLVPSSQEIEEILLLLRKETKSLDNNVFLVYGGSVNVENAAEIIAIPEINGLLIGKASTDSDKLNLILESTNSR